MGFNIENLDPISPVEHLKGIHDMKGYLKGQGDLVSSLINPITHIVTLVIPLNHLLSKFP